MLILLTVGAAFSQTITGMVMEPGGTGIPDVHILVSNTPIGTSAGNDGRFRLDNIPVGSMLRISAVGYTSQELPVVDTIVSITLEPSLLYLNHNIVVTAQRFEASQFDVLESMTVLNSSDIIQQAPRSTPEALFGSAGVWIQKTNHGGGSPIIRGLVGNHVLLMMDGIRLNNATYRYGPNQYLSTIDPGLMDRVEVTRGSGSVLYGSDALGGVVHILSKNPSFNERKNFKVKLYGKWVNQSLEKSGRSEMQFSSKKVAAMLGVSARDFGNIVAGDTLGTLTPTGYQEYAGDAKILFRWSTNGFFTGAYQHHTQYHVPRYDQVSLGGYKTYNFDPQTRQLAYVRWETSSGSKYFQRIRITGSWSRSVEGVISQKKGSDIVKNQRDVVNTKGIVVETTSQWKSNWSSQTGIEYYHDKVNSSTSSTDMVQDETIAQRGSFSDGATSTSMAFFSNHVMEWKEFQLTAGCRVNVVKVNVNDTTFGSQQITPSAVVGNLGLMYVLNPNLHWIISANSAFRAPNIDDMSKFGAIESTVFEIPSTTLAPERSFSIETGFKVSAEKISGTLTFYKTHLSDLIDRVGATFLGQDTVENRKVYQKQNVGKVQLCGIEADAEYTMLHDLVVMGNVTYTYGQNISKDEPMRRIPPLFGKLGLKYQPDPQWWAKTEWIMAGGQHRLAGGDLADSRIFTRLVNGVIPGWNLWSVYAGIKIKNVNITASVQNILDKGYRVYGSGVDGYGRNCWVAATVQF